MSFPAIFKPYFRSLQIPEVTSITLLIFFNYNYQFTYGLVSLHFSEQVPAFLAIIYVNGFGTNKWVRRDTGIYAKGDKNNCQKGGHLTDFDLWMIWNYLTIFLTIYIFYSLC